MAELPAVARALLDTIAGPESKGAYDVIYGGDRITDFSDHPRQYVTIASGPNAGKKSSAAGKYQILASTWGDYAPRAGVTDFTPASQDAVAWAIAKDEYRRDTGRSLQDDLEAGDLSRVPSSLRNQWTSLPGGIEQGIGNRSFLSAYQSNLDNPALGAIGSATSSQKPPGVMGSLWGGLSGGLLGAVDYAKLQAAPAIKQMESANPGMSLMQAMGSLQGRTAIGKMLMGMNIPQAPRAVPGIVAGGTPVTAVNRNGTSLMSLMRPDSGRGSESSRAFEDTYHEGQNMDVYRANHAALGGTMTQDAIGRALAGGATLYKSAPSSNRSTSSSGSTPRSLV